MIYSSVYRLAAVILASGFVSTDGKRRSRNNRWIPVRRAARRRWINGEASTRFFALAIVQQGAGQQRCRCRGNVALDQRRAFSEIAHGLRVEGREKGLVRFLPQLY